MTYIFLALISVASFAVTFALNVFLKFIIYTAKRLKERW